MKVGNGNRSVFGRWWAYPPDPGRGIPLFSSGSFSEIHSRGLGFVGFAFSKFHPVSIVGCFS